MKISYVEIAGFRSCRDRLRVDFGTGLTVITGRNGVGKSTIMDAIEFVLTGTISKYKVERAKGGGLADHTWWVGDEPAQEKFVEVGFLDARGQDFNARRTPSGLETGIQNLAELLLNANHDSTLTLTKLCQTMIIRDEQISELSLDLSERDRFRAVLDAISPDTAPDVGAKLDELVKLANSELNEAGEEQERLKSKLASLLDEVANLRGSMPGQEAFLVAQSDRIAAEAEIRALIPPLTFERETALTQLASYFTTARDLRNRFDTQLREFSDRNHLESEIAELNEILIRESGTINRLRTDKLQLTDELKGLSVVSKDYEHLAILLEHGESYGLKDGHCPLCDAARSSEQFLEFISQQKSRVGEVAQVLAKKQSQLSDVETELSVANDRFSETQRKKDQLQDRLKSQNAARAKLENEASALGLAEFANDILGFDERLEQIRKVGSRLRDSQARLSSSQTASRIEGLDIEIGQIRSRIDELAGQIAGKRSILDRAKSLNDLARAFPKEILEEQFETVMPLLKELYRRLRPHTDWREIDYSFGGRVIASLNFRVGEDKNPQFLFSSGQRRATGLAFLLAVHLSRQWATLKTLMLDDPVQHIDDYRALNLVEVLAAIRREKRQVIVAVEDTALADLLARRLRGPQSDSDVMYVIGTGQHGGSVVREARNLPPLNDGVLVPKLAS